jgi:biopolymer transport protein TolQ
METVFQLAELSAQGILYFLGLLSLISVAIMIERYSMLKDIFRASAGINEKLRKVIGSQDFAQIEVMSKDAASIEGRALKNGVAYLKKHGETGLRELFESFKGTERPLLEKNLNYLGTIASNAPYVGLLGTVLGIMKAFNDLAVAPGQGNEVVMAGIGHALVSTAIGLAVAIPAVVGYNLFQKRVSLLIANIDAAADLCVAYAKIRRE